MLACQRAIPSTSSPNLPTPTDMKARLKTIWTRRNTAAARRAYSVSRPAPKRTSFHSAKVMTPERRIHLAWNAM